MLASIKIATKMSYPVRAAWPAHRHFRDVIDLTARHREFCFRNVEDISISDFQYS
jgi:hypothetical protein